jgi:hypothetical protein
LRSRLASSLGPSFGKKAAFEWWLQNKADQFPLEASKLRRVYESFFGTLTPLPYWAREKGFWGMLNAMTKSASRFEAFHFHVDGDSAVTITLQRSKPVSPDEIEQSAKCDALCTEVLQQDRAIAMRFTPSSMSLLAMIWGPQAGQAGADPKKIVKLFSAAKSWGPGCDSWHKLDDTWLCVDAKNTFGQVIEEQGRLIWRRPSFKQNNASQTESKYYTESTLIDIAPKSSKQKLQRKTSLTWMYMCIFVAVSTVMLLGSVAHAIEGR